MRRKIRTLLVGTALLAATLGVAQQPAAAEPHGKAMPTQLKYYDIAVSTGDVSGGGTDADVWILIKAANQDRDQFLENVGHDDFERGSVSTFRIANPDLGEIRQICMRRNSSGLFPDWYLAWVRISWQDGGVRKSRTARFGGWMPSGIYICRNAHTP